MKIEKKRKNKTKKGKGGKKKREDDNYDAHFCDNCSLLYIIVTFHYLR